MLVISCNNWILIWLGLEINIVSFIIIIYSKYRILNVESCMKYFFIQRLGSVILLILIYLRLDIFSFLGRMILCYKIGGGPFYFWFPSICKSIRWWSCFFLIRFQKIIPIILISLFIRRLVWVIGFIRLVVGVIGRINQVNVKELIAFSSVHHIGWILIRFIIRDDFWIIYLFIYRFILLRLIIVLQIKFVHQIQNVMRFEKKNLVLLILLNLGGIPPIIGFFLKWWSFYYFLIFDWFLIIFLLIFSVIILYIYIRMVYDFIIGGGKEFIWKVKVRIAEIIYYDNIIIIRFCLGPFIGILFL